LNMGAQVVNDIVLTDAFLISSSPIFYASNGHVINKKYFNQ
jgi:hypothetical protein